MIKEHLTRFVGQVLFRHLLEFFRVLLYFRVLYQPMP